jgi:hypothetical protein
VTTMNDEDPPLPGMPAMFLALTPTGEVPCCVVHARQMARVMHSLGTHLSFLRAPESAQCSNCVNEAKKATTAEARGNLTGDAGWLWTHCRSLGMARKSDSGLLRDDIALFVADLHSALRELVECEELADRYDELKQNVQDVATATVLKGIQVNYKARQPAAWATARSLLGP